MTNTLPTSGKDEIRTDSDSKHLSILETPFNQKTKEQTKRIKGRFLSRKNSRFIKYISKNNWLYLLEVLANRKYF